MIASSGRSCSPLPLSSTRAGGTRAAGAACSAITRTTFGGSDGGDDDLFERPHFFDEPLARASLTATSRSRRRPRPPRARGRLSSVAAPTGAGSWGASISGLAGSSYDKITARAQDARDVGEGRHEPQRARMSGGGSFGDASWLLQRVASATASTSGRARSRPRRRRRCRRRRRPRRPRRPPRRPRRRASPRRRRPSRRGGVAAMGIPELANLPFALGGFAMSGAAGRALSAAANTITPGPRPAAAAHGREAPARASARRAAAPSPRRLSRPRRAPTPTRLHTSDRARTTRAHTQTLPRNAAAASHQLCARLKSVSAAETHTSPHTHHFMQSLHPCACERGPSHWPVTNQPHAPLTQPWIPASAHALGHLVPSFHDRYGTSPPERRAEQHAHHV